MAHVIQLVLMAIFKALKVQKDQSDPDAALEAPAKYGISNDLSWPNTITKVCVDFEYCIITQHYHIRADLLAFYLRSGILSK